MSLRPRPSSGYKRQNPSVIKEQSLPSEGYNVVRVNEDIARKVADVARLLYARASFRSRGATSAFTTGLRGSCT